MKHIRRRLAIVLGTMLAVATTAACLLPAVAQPFEDRYPYERGRRSREFVPFFGGERIPAPPGAIPFIRPPQPADSSKAPPPRKAEGSTNTTVLVIGDSFAEWLAYGLEEAFADSADVGVARRIKPAAGLIRYDPRGDTPEWSQVVREMLAAERPNAIVVMLGLNDRQPLRDRPAPRPAPPAPSAVAAQAAPSGQPGQPLSLTSQGNTPAAPAGAASTAQPANQAPPQNAAAAEAAPPGTSAPAGSPTAPTSEPAQHPPAAAPAPTAAASAPAPPNTEPPRQVQGPSYEFRTDKWAELYAKRIDEMIAALKSRGVPVLWVGLPAIRGAHATSDMSYLNDLYRTRAEKAGIPYVNVWDGFVDDTGRYMPQGPDFEGQIRRLRSSDGIYFTKAGALKLAHYVERDLRRALSRRVTPAALPGPEASQSKAGAGARPLIGPVIPLSATGSEAGELLGAGRPPPAPDPVAARVLSRGDAIPPAPGRADDFSWPRGQVNRSAAPAAGPVAATPVPTTVKVDATPSEPKKNETNRTEASRSETNKSEAAKVDTAKTGSANAGSAHKNNDHGKAETKKPSDAGNSNRREPDATPKVRRSRADLDGGPPRPRAPVGGAH